MTELVSLAHSSACSQNIRVMVDGCAAALWVQPQIIGEADKSGRPRPNKADLPEVRIPADIIVVAIGQGIEIQGFEQAGVPIKRGTFVAGLSGQVGDMDNLFAGGDCVTGPATAIRAIAAGKVAAAAGQDNAVAGNVAQSLFRQFLVDEFKNFFNARCDDADEFSLGNLFD